MVPVHKGIPIQSGNRHTKCDFNTVKLYGNFTILEYSSEMEARAGYNRGTEEGLKFWKLVAHVNMT